MTYFSCLHPLTKAIYYGLLFLCIMVVFDPLAMLLVLAALVLLSPCKETERMKGYGRFFTVLAVTIILINFAFNHRGDHILFYALDRPMTLEALLYGAVSALLIICIILLFQSVSGCIATSEFLYLFRGTIPEMGMLVSMTCGFFQAFAERGAEIGQAVRMKDIEIGNGTLRERSLAGMQIMHVLIGLTLENALTTVMSMKTRAFDMKRRTCGTVYKIRRRDVAFMTVTVLLASVVIAVWVSGIYNFSVYPSIKAAPPGAGTAAFYAAYAGMLALPAYRAGSYKKKMLLQKEGRL